MIENKDADLSLLKDYFVDGEVYSKDEILYDLQQKQKEKGFLCVLVDDGFLIAYPTPRNTLWVSQMVNYGKWRDTRDMIEYAKQWAKERGMIGLVGETDRTELRAIKRLGWEQVSIIVGIRV